MDASREPAAGCPTRQRRDGPQGPRGRDCTYTNDLGQFTFKTINLTSTATVVETIAGNSLQLPTTGDGTILQNGSGAFDIQNNITSNPAAGQFTYSPLHLTADAVAGRTGTVTLSGILSDAAPTVRLALDKQGPNTAILTGANTYSGGTTIGTAGVTPATGGTLLVNNNVGSGTGSGLVVVNNGTLGGTGFITVAPVEGNDQVSVNNGGIVAPGNGPGQIGALTLSDITTSFNAGPGLLIDPNAITSDLLKTNGQLLIDPTATIQFNQLATPTAPSYTLVTYGGHSGFFAFDSANIPAGYEPIYNPGELDLVAVPEPGTWAAALLAAGAVAAAARRARRPYARQAS